MPIYEMSVHFPAGVMRQFLTHAETETEATNRISQVLIQLDQSAEVIGITGKIAHPDGMVIEYQGELWPHRPDSPAQ